MRWLLVIQDRDQAKEFPTLARAMNAAVLHARCRHGDEFWPEWSQVGDLAQWTADNGFYRVVRV